MSTKLYIVVRNDIDVGHAILGACHGVAAFFLRFSEYPDVREWVALSFRKVLVHATKEEFDRVKEHLESLNGRIHHVVMTECALDGQETAIVAGPESRWGDELRKLPLWPPQEK